MWPQCHRLDGGQDLIIREAVPEDAGVLLDYVQAISSESQFLTFGPGEFSLTVAEEERFLRKCAEAENQLYIIGLVDGAIVSSLDFSGGGRPRTRHAGEFGVSVRRAYWGLGIGSRMIEALIGWAQSTGTVTKISLRVRTDHHRAIALYERMGFVVEGRLRREFWLDGEYYDHFWMGLLL